MYLSIAAAAAIIGVTPRAVYKRLRKGSMAFPLTIAQCEALRIPPSARKIAAQLGVDRRTVYRWREEGRTDTTKRPRGPRRSPKSKRYTIGRHTYKASATAMEKSVI